MRPPTEGRRTVIAAALLDTGAGVGAKKPTLETVPPCARPG